MKLKLVLTLLTVGALLSVTDFGVAQTISSTAGIHGGQATGSLQITGGKRSHARLRQTMNSNQGFSYSRGWSVDRNGRLSASLSYAVNRGEIGQAGSFAFSNSSRRAVGSNTVRGYGAKQIGSSIGVTTELDVPEVRQRVFIKGAGQSQSRVWSQIDH